MTLAPAPLAALLAAFCAALLSSCDKPKYAGPVQTGIVDPAPGKEISGIAPSRRDNNLFWVHNDSIGKPVLYAIDTHGRFRGSVRLNNTKNTDWEDITSFELDGQAWLLIADVGDNKGNRRNYALHVIAEPDPADLSPQKELTATVAWTIPVVYPDGSHDCEAVAVDARDRIVYLLTKRTIPPLLFSLPLHPPTDGRMPAATLVTRLTGIPQPSSWQRLLPTPTGRFKAEPTALDIASDRSAAAILTYGNLLYYPRSPGEKWAKALARAPEILPPYDLAQAEAVCFSRDNQFIYVSGEQKNPPLLRYSLSHTAGP